MKLSDSTRRTLRTLLQFVAALPGILATLQLVAANDPTIAAALATAAAWVIVVTKIQNALEDAGVIPPLLKTPAAEGATADAENADPGVG